MKVAALDLGTNTFLCLVCEVNQGQISKVYSDQVEVVRLGEGVNQTKEFAATALKRARETLNRFSETIQAEKPDFVLAMATSAARDVTNAEELFQIGNDLNIPIEIIPGSSEAEITFFGSISGPPKDGKLRAIIDVGGGSTEVIIGTDKKIHFSTSIDIGAVRMTEKFFPSQPPSADQVLEMSEFCIQKIDQALKQAPTESILEVLAVAGTPTELVSVQIGGFDAKKIDGYTLSGLDLVSWIEKFNKTSTEDRIRQFGISKGRADVILAGTKILELVLNRLGKKEMKVSTRGVRFGVALEIGRRNP